jgi:hypothetical protein
MRDDVQRTRQLQDSRKSSSNFIGTSNALRSSSKEMKVVVDDVEEQGLLVARYNVHFRSTSISDLVKPSNFLSVHYLILSSVRNTADARWWDSHSTVQYTYPCARVAWIPGVGR